MTAPRWDRNPFADLFALSGAILAVTGLVVSLATWHWSGLVPLGCGLALLVAAAVMGRDDLADWLDGPTTEAETPTLGAITRGEES